MTKYQNGKTPFALTKHEWVCQWDNYLVNSSQKAGGWHWYRYGIMGIYNWRPTFKLTYKPKIFEGQVLDHICVVDTRNSVFDFCVITLENMLFWECCYHNLSMDWHHVNFWFHWLKNVSFITQLKLVKVVTTIFLVPIPTWYLPTLTHCPSSRPPTLAWCPPSMSPTHG